jgi:uncharacterized protein YceK
MTRATLFILVVFSSLFCGCGTFADAMAGPADDHLYYRGVRMDVAGVKNGLPIMAFDVPFSLCADTLLVPSIAIGQLTDPPGTKFKSAFQITGEELAKSVTTTVIVPVTAEVLKAVETELRNQQSISVATPIGSDVEKTGEVK